MAAKLTISGLVWFSASSAPSHSTGDKERKVEELAILSRGKGLESHSSPLNWLVLWFFLSFNTFKTGHLGVWHTKVFSRAGTEELSMLHDSNILPVTSIVPPAGWAVEYLPQSALSPQQLYQAIINIYQRQI